MKFKGAAASLPLMEQEKILYYAAKHGVHACFLAAVRMGENGGPGKEFGVLDVRADTYDKQCDDAARSIRNNLFRFISANDGMWPVLADRYSNVFIAYMGRRWAPLGVLNDPTNLNRNWIVNVTNFYKDSDLEEEGG